MLMRSLTPSVQFSSNKLIGMIDSRGHVWQFPRVFVSKLISDLLDAVKWRETPKMRGRDNDCNSLPRRNKMKRKRKRKEAEFGSYVELVDEPMSVCA